jgi:HlyD family secretion protein
MLRDVRGLGTLVRAENSNELVARVTPEDMAHEVRLNQNAVVDTHKGFVKGHVSRINPSSNGTRSVDIAFDAALPEGAGVDLPIECTIDIEKLENILSVGRPVYASANTEMSLFELVNGGKEAVRVKVKFGGASVNRIEVLAGLKEGDTIILSDMSDWNNVDRIQIRGKMP